MFRLICACLVMANCCLLVGDAAEHSKDSLDKIRQSLKTKKAVIIDVRSKREWDAGHLKAAAFVPLSEFHDGKLPEKIVKKLPPKKITIYCHCRSGGRALLAADVLKEKGYDIRPLKQGYEDLLKAGFEKAKDKAAASN